MPNVSVIMPLFNAEKYLPDALQSVLRQTYKDFELICIDDCSTDHTAEILMDFQGKDMRIKVERNKERLGAGASRNKGLKASRGQYAIFLDGDDIFEEELLEKASGAMEKYQVDIVCFEALHVPSETIHIKREIERSDDFIRKYCKEPFAVNDFKVRDFKRSNAPWDKMFLRSFLEENKLEFQDLPSSNDVYFVNMALFCAKRIIRLDDRRVMVYVRDHSEPSRISNDRDPMCAYFAMEKLAMELNKRNMFIRFAKFYYYTLAFAMLNLVKKEKSEMRKKKFYDFLHEEGISKCVEYGEDCYEQIDAYDRYLLESFQNNVYESRWFENLDTYFQCYLKKKGYVICDFIKGKISENMNFILWGIGVNGRILLDYLKEHSIRISGVVDHDKTKQGTIVNGFVIAAPDVVVQKADYIIVTSVKLCHEVSEAVKNTSTVVINLLYLLMGESDS